MAQAKEALFAILSYNTLMLRSRLSRLEERKQRKRLTLALVGSIAVLIFVGLFGVRVLIGFSLLVDRIRGTSPQTQQSSSLILPPVLDPQPTATNSASINITGRGQGGLTLIVYLNEGEFKKIRVPEDGSFSVTGIPLSNGSNSISAKLTDDKDGTSDLSNVLSVTYATTPPNLEITAPEDNANISGEPNTVAVTGTTDDDINVTINDRLVVVRGDNSFSYNYPLNEGDNILTIVATDAAGNQTRIERKVIYRR